MSNMQENMILDQEFYNEANKEQDLEDKAKNFYQDIDSCKKEEKSKSKNSKSTNALFRINKKGGNLFNLTHENIKPNFTVINNIKGTSSEKKNDNMNNISNINNKNPFIIKIMNNTGKKDKKEQKINSNNTETDINININNYSHENMINNNYKEPEEHNIIKNMMEIENDKDKDKDEDLFGEDNEELIGNINDNKYVDDIFQEQSSLYNKSSSTIILFVGCSGHS